MTQEQGVENRHNNVESRRPHGILANEAIANLLSNGKKLPPDFTVWKATLPDGDKQNPLLEEISVLIRDRTPLEQHHFERLKERGLVNRAGFVVSGLQVADIPEDSWFDELNNCTITGTTIKNLHVELIDNCTIETEMHNAEIDSILSSTFTALSYSKCLKIIDCTFDCVMCSKIGIGSAGGIQQCTGRTVNNCTLRGITDSTIDLIIENRCNKSIIGNYSQKISDNEGLKQEEVGLEGGHITELRIIDNICPEINGNTGFVEVQDQ